MQYPTLPGGILWDTHVEQMSADFNEEWIVGMELNQSEVSDGKLWLLCAGACALALSFFIYRVDEYMVHAPAREHQHNIMMNELRSAQTGLRTVDVDHRQALPLAMEKESNAGLPFDVTAGHKDGGHDDHHGAPAAESAHSSH